MVLNMYENFYDQHVYTFLVGVVVVKELSNVNCVEVSARCVKCVLGRFHLLHTLKSKKYANIENVPLNLVA